MHSSTSPVADDGGDTLAPNTGPGLQATFRPILAGRRRRALEGLILGSLAGLCANLLGINDLIHVPVLQDIVLLPALAGVLVALTPARPILRLGSAILLAAVVIIGYTPLIDRLMPSILVSEPLSRASAIVVLSTAPHKDNTLDGRSQQRLIHGYSLVRQGYARSLVLTRSIPDIGDQTPAAREQMRMLGFDFPVDVVGPVANTHDEAVAVARLARTRGWSRVILVTHPWHMRRARGVFVKAGVDVICSPCDEGEYDIHNLTGPGYRFLAFGDWLHETIGYQVYRLRGWL